MLPGDTIIAYTWAFGDLSYIDPSFLPSLSPSLPSINSSIHPSFHLIIYLIFFLSLSPFFSPSHPPFFQSIHNSNKHVWRYQAPCQALNSLVQRDTHRLALFFNEITERNLTMQENQVIIASKHEHLNWEPAFRWHPILFHGDSGIMLIWAAGRVTGTRI